jgi:hypothetical protein
MVSLSGLLSAALAVVGPAAAGAQGTDPFPDDQQPVGNEYGLPPLDHHGSHAGGGGGGGGASTGGGGAGTSGTTGAGASAGGAGTAASGGALTASAVRRGEARNDTDTGAGAGTRSGERLGISDVPPRPTLSAGEDTRGGFDVLLIVLAGVAGAGLLLAAILSAARPGRPAA